VPQSPVTNEDLLTCIGQGYSITQACKIKGISRTAVYSRLKKDPEFRLQVDRLLASPGHGIKNKVLELGGEPDDDWRRTFIVWWKKTGSRETAANYVGKTPTEIHNYLDPLSDDYDKEFRGLYDDEIKRKEFAIEDNFFRAAEEGRDRTAQKFLLERLNPERYKPPKETATHQTAVFWFSGEGEDQAKGLLNNLFGDSNTGSNDSIPASNVGGLLDVGGTPKDS